MQGKRFIHRLSLKNLLSYGSQGVEIDLQPLNVLIGPNGSGKSNFIEAIRLLRATSQPQPYDLAFVVSQGGGVEEWLWQGDKQAGTAELSAVIDYPDGNDALHYLLKFTSVGQRLELTDEAIEREKTISEDDFFYRYREGQATLTPGINNNSITQRPKFYLDKQKLSLNQSILSQIKDPYTYPELFHLQSQLSAIHIYELWGFLRDKPPRQPVRTDLPKYPLFIDGYNLALAINHLQKQLGTKDFHANFIEKLKKSILVSRVFKLQLTVAQYKSISKRA